ncbi:MAG: hypothetical protein L0215_25685, partial [Gemmataceae bacterium]|nr:hypothetical protein [Gemmataceae bacterium]
MLSLAGMLCGPNAAHAQEDLPGLFEKAPASFTPVTDKELADARADLDARMKAVEQFVRPSSENGKKWLKYLRWDDLKNALAAEGAPDLRALATTYQRLNRDENGLELSAFRRLADALQRFMQLSRIAQQPDQAKYFGSQLDRLRTQLDEYRGTPTDATAVEIGSRLAFIEGLNTAPDLVAAVRREFVRPNAFMDIATELIAEGAEPINRREPVRDCILGTSIRSDAHTTGSVGVATIPSDDKAVIEFISEGRTNSRNVGNNGPAVIRSTANTDFTATKRVELSDAEFSATASRSHATTDTHFQSVSKRGGGLGSRLVSNIGWKRAHQNERRAESIAADHAEDRIDRRFNDELNEEVQKARERYENDYRRPLERRGAVPKHIRFSSDKDSVNLEVAQASASQLGAAGAPPDAPSGHDMSMRLHDSAVNNYSANLLGGATASQTEPDEDLKFDVKLPDWMKDAWKNRKTEATDSPADAGPFKPYSLRFRDGRPLSVDFADGKVKLTIHISRLKSGEETFANWDVTGIYIPELSDGGILLRRDGDLVMLPADFKGSLSSRQVAERSNLEKELNARSAQGRGFPKTVEFEALQPEDNLKTAGPLEYNQFNSDGGWLTVAWDRRK